MEFKGTYNRKKNVNKRKTGRKTDTQIDRKLPVCFPLLVGFRAQGQP